VNWIREPRHVSEYSKWLVHSEFHSPGGVNTSGVEPGPLTASLRESVRLRLGIGHGEQVKGDVPPTSVIQRPPAARATRRLPIRGVDWPITTTGIVRLVSTLVVALAPSSSLPSILTGLTGKTCSVWI
jgi:hypothetical protein